MTTRQPAIIPDTRGQRSAALRPPEPPSRHPSPHPSLPRHRRLTSASPPLHRPTSPSQAPRLGRLAPGPTRCSHRARPGPPAAVTPRTARALPLALEFRPPRRKPGNKRSQGGVKFPTGGQGRGNTAQARERPTTPRGRGQQTRCDSGADGHSPDERERDPLPRGLRQPARLIWDVLRCASQRAGVRAHPDFWQPLLVSP